MTVSDPSASHASSANAGWRPAAIESQAVVVSLQKYLLAIAHHTFLRNMVQPGLPSSMYFIAVQTASFLTSLYARMPLLRSTAHSQSDSGVVHNK